MVGCTSEFRVDFICLILFFLLPVTTLLPIRAASKELKENPQFTNLLHQLSQLLTPEGVSHYVHQDLLQAEEILRHEKHVWLQHLVLHHELQEMILDYELRANDNSISIADKEVFIENFSNNVKTLYHCISI